MQKGLQQALGWALVVFGALVVIFGLWAVGAYIWGVIEVLDEADQSWMFWGLAILFIGFFTLGIGGFLCVLGRRIVKTGAKGAD